MALMDSATDSLSLLVKRHKDSDPQDPEGIEHNFGVQEPDEGGLESTTLQIWPERELYISESQDEAYYGESESDPEISGRAPTGPVKAVSTFEVPIPGGPKGTFNTGATLELQLSLTEHIPEASIGGALVATATENDGKVVLETSTCDDATATAVVTVPHPFPIQDRVPLGQRGEIEVTLRGLGTGTQREEKEGEGEGVEGRERGCVDPETGPSGQVSFSVSSSTEAQTGNHSDSESEGDPSEPSKHRARHARLRRSESLSEKQVKEAKSKCKRIALLLTAAPNPTNKGVLMFKRRRQRAKKYTLVSYGTGETEPEESEDDEDEEEAQAVQFTLLDASESGLDDDFLAKAQGRGHILTLDWDTGLLEIEKKLDDGEDMECLPETKGKGALMFAKRRQRVDEITAEQEEMRKRGLPVEAVPLEAQAPLVSMQRSYQVEEHTYTQSPGGHIYMDVNVQQQQQPQYHQYQQQQMLHQQQQYQQQQQYEQQQQHYQQQQFYQQQHYEQEQHYQQQQQQQYSHTVNGVVAHQVDPCMAPNITAKPFTGVQNRVAAPFMPSQPQAWAPAGSGEQIASRDERIAVPAIKTGILQETRKKTMAKPMFTFKETPKMTPNPELLNLLNRQERKPGFESEEDYLSLGAEACNFLQPSSGKKKVPPPVAPKPAINPTSPPWTPELENTLQTPSQPAQYAAGAPGEAPTPETSHPMSVASAGDRPAWHEAPPTVPENSASPPQQATVSSWSPAEPLAQPMQPVVQNHEPSYQSVSTWAPAQSEVQPQVSVLTWAPTQSESQPQAPISTCALTQNESQPEVPVTAWASAHSETQPPALVTSSAHTQNESPPEALVTTLGPTQNESLPEAPVSTWAPTPNESPPEAPVTTWAPAQNESPPEVLVSTWAPAQSETQPQAPVTAWAPAQSETQPLAPVTAWAPAQSETQLQAPMTAWASAQSVTQPQAPVTAWAPAQSETQPQAPVTAWAPTQSESQPSWVPPPQPPPRQTKPQAPTYPPPRSPADAQSQPPWPQPTTPQSEPETPPHWPPPPQPQLQSPTAMWAPRPNHAPASVVASAPHSHIAAQQPIRSQNQSDRSMGPPAPPQRMNSYTRVSKALSDSPGGVGPAFEMPALRGKGAELFAKRQSRMEKYVVDSATVEANRVKNQSPTASLPGSWKYSSNIRAPPPLSYNPIQSPSYPPGAVKPGASSKTGPAPKAKAKGKGKPIKPLPALDVMKYQPYQLNSSLFTYGAAVEASPKPASPAPTPAAHAPVSQNQPIRYEKAAAVQPSGPVSAHYPASSQQPQSPVYPSHGPPPPDFLDDMSYQMAANSYQQPPIPVYQPGHTLPSEHASSPPYQQVFNPAYQPGPAPAYQAGPNPAYQQAPSPPYAVAPTGVSQPGPNPGSPSSYAVPKFPVSSKAEPAAGSPVLAAPKPKFFAKKSDAQVWKPGAAAQE